MMPIYKYWIIYELEIWTETFNNNYPDHMEEVIEKEKKGYDYIHYLIVVGNINSNLKIRIDIKFCDFNKLNN